MILLGRTHSVSNLSDVLLESTLLRNLRAYPMAETSALFVSVSVHCQLWLTSDLLNPWHSNCYRIFRIDRHKHLHCCTLGKFPSRIGLPKTDWLLHQIAVR